MRVFVRPKRERGEHNQTEISYPTIVPRGYILDECLTKMKTERQKKKKYLADERDGEEREEEEGSCRGPHACQKRKHNSTSCVTK